MADRKPLEKREELQQNVPVRNVTHDVQLSGYLRGE